MDIRRKCIVVLICILFVCLTLVFSCDPLLLTGKLVPLDSDLILKLGLGTYDTHKLSMLTEKEYSCAVSLRYEPEVIGNSIVLKITGVYIPVMQLGIISRAGNSFSLDDLTYDRYTVTIMYDTSVDVYNLTVDSVKFEMSPQYGTFTRFENTADMMVYR
jgi:hypothetical protein